MKTRTFRNLIVVAAALVVTTLVGGLRPAQADLTGPKPPKRTQPVTMPLSTPLAGDTTTERN